MKKFSLIDPTELLQEYLLPMLNKIGKEEGGFQGVEEPLNSESFPAYVRRLTDETRGMNLPEGWVPMNTYWLLKGGNHPVGISKLRHHLTEELTKRGGHIGYWVRSSERRKGYGKEDREVTDEDLRDFAAEHAEACADLGSVSFGDFTAFTYSIAMRNGNFGVSTGYVPIRSCFT